jgi:hypothetical protein
MTTLNSTTHAAARMSQRGIRDDDLELILEIGTEVEGGYIVLKKDYRAYDCELKRKRERVRRLVGKRVVVEGDRVVTAYHAEPKKQRRLIRGAEDRSLQD